MLVQVLGLAQVSFRLRVRREDLAVLSMKQVDTLMIDMGIVQNLIIGKGYLVTVQLTLDGAMMSIKE